MSALANEHRAINLGQGFPDVDGPLAIREAAARALREGPNQYPPMRGRVELRKAIAGHAKRFYGFDLDPERDVVVTSGATEALTASIMGLAGPGGEVVLIEPAYDSYAPIAQSVGAVVRYVRLAPPNWRLTEAMLREAISKRTQAIVVNSPLNPIGRVFDREELAALARVVAESNAVVISDEVYEHLTFDGRPHVSPAALPGLNGRVARIGSAGKMFSLTGWKVGWVTGPSELVRAVANAHQLLTFTPAPSLQLAVAYALEHEMDFTTGLTRELQAN